MTAMNDGVQAFFVRHPTTDPGVAQYDANGRALIYPGPDGTWYRAGEPVKTLWQVRDDVVAAELAAFDRDLSGHLRPGAQIAIGGARAAHLDRDAGRCEGYIDNGFALTYNETPVVVCALSGCHRTREQHRARP